MEHNSIEILKSLNLKEVGNEEVKRLLNEQKNVASLLFKIEKNRSVYRSLLMSDSSTKFKEKSRISYHPNPPTYGRANIPNMPVFYGSITTERSESDLLKYNFQESVGEFNKHNHGYLVNLFECSNILVDTENEVKEGKEIFTIGKWVLKLDIELPYVVDMNPTVELTEKMKKSVEEGLISVDETTSKELVDFNQLLSDEFSKKVHKDEEYKYKITANYTEKAISAGYSGIIYPSVKAKREGLNVAISPELFDDNSIELESVVRIRIYKKADKTVFWDWIDKADYCAGQPLNYTPIKGISLTDFQVFQELYKRGMHHFY